MQESYIAFVRTGTSVEIRNITRVLNSIMGDYLLGVVLNKNIMEILYFEIILQYNEKVLREAPKHI